MTREFIMLPEFDRQWSKMGFKDKDLKNLQEELTIDSSKGDIMQGTGGLRKIRFAKDSKGKSGGVRVCYVDFPQYDRIYLITAYTKNDKDNLSKSERSSIKKLIKLLEKSILERSN